jgi:hypothetical protein
MARKLKTYQTSLGFFEQAIAAPSEMRTTQRRVLPLARSWNAGELKKSALRRP